MTEELLIAKTMTIGEVVAKYPKSTEIMTRYGLHCLGCQVNPFESLEMGAKGHGMSDATFASMMQELNAKLAGVQPVQADPSRVIAITDTATGKLREIMQSQNMSDHALRIEVMSGGCAGYTYGFDLAKEPKEHDTVIEDNGIRMFIPAESLAMIRGSCIDYVESIAGGGFQVANPGATSSCGCGKSFH